MSSVAFDDMFSIRRGKELFFCFMQAKQKLFSNVDDITFSNALRQLEVDVVPCTGEEFFSIQQRLPDEFFPFNLIKEQDLLRLKGLLQLDLSPTIDSSPNLTPRHSGPDNQSNYFTQPPKLQTNTKPLESSFFMSTFSVGANVAGVGPSEKDNQSSWWGQSLPVPNFPVLQSQPGPHQSSDRSLRDTGNELTSTTRLESNVPHLTNYSLDKETRAATPTGADSPHTEGQVPCVEASEDKDVTKSRRRKTLSESEMPTSLCSELAEIRNFYSLNLNCDREGSSLQSSTIDKMLERVNIFLWFMKKVKGMEPTLSQCASPQLVQDFVKFMMEKQGSKPVTCSRYLSAIISVDKVPFVCARSEEREAALEKIRAIQRQLERLSRKERVEEVSVTGRQSKVVYSELLDLCRELQWEVTEKTGSVRARSSMNLCLLLLYCTANPGRVKEYISLRIYKDQTADQMKGHNFICFNEDGSVILIEDNYKTRPTYGTNRTDLTSMPFLTYHLELYNSKLRSLLLNGKEHDYFFVGPRGDRFSHAAYTNYVSALFEKYFSRKLTTVDLRKAVVNHFLSLPESGDQSLRESLATVMKHSVRTQQKYYDERPLEQKKEKALDLLSSMACRTLGEDSVEVVSDEDEEGNIEYLPTQGEFVALVAANSTKHVPEVFVAKILRLSQDRKMAYLAEFSESEPGKFRLNAGKSFREKVRALIYPIDIVYLHSDGLYELRTPKIDIHNQVYARDSKK